MKRRSFLSLSIVSPPLVMLDVSALEVKCAVCGGTAHAATCSVEGDRNVQI